MSLLTRTPRRAIGIGIGAAALSFAVVGTSFASGVFDATDEQGVINACVNTKSGLTRILAAGTDCKAGEQVVSWNVTGEAGATGPAGEKGDTGAQGIQGEKGDTGAQGIQGDTGDTGATGPAGADGRDGAQGAPGATGAPGVAGVAGKSAYELAVDGGFVGTQEQWLTSLDGTDGTNGTNGTNGAPGLVPAASCPAGEFMTGVAAGGALVCSPLPVAVVPVDLAGCYVQRNGDPIGGGEVILGFLWTGTDGRPNNLVVYQNESCTGNAVGRGTIYLPPSPEVAAACPAGSFSPISLSGFSPAFPAGAILCAAG